MKRNDKGFSYLELLAVMAVAAIMVGMITITVGTVSRNDVLRSSEKLETMVNKARVNAMAKGSATAGGGGNGWINIARSGGTYYASIGAYSDDPDEIKKNGEKIGSAKMDIYVAGEEDDMKVTETNVRHLGFKQSTGGIFAGAGEIIFLVKSKDISYSFTVNGTTGQITRD